MNTQKRAIEINRTFDFRTFDFFKTAVRVVKKDKFFEARVTSV